MPVYTTRCPKREFIFALKVFIFHSDEMVYQRNQRFSIDPKCEWKINEAH